MIISDVPNQLAGVADGPTLIAAAGPLHTSVSSILSSVLGTSVLDPALPTDTGAALHVTQARELGAVVFTLDGVDDARASELDTEDALTLALALCGITVYAVDVRDLARASATGLPRLLSTATRAATLTSAQSGEPLPGVTPKKKLLMVVITGYDSEDGSTEKDVRDRVDAILGDMETVQKAFAYVDVALLPDARHVGEEAYSEATAALRERLIPLLPAHTDSIADDKNIALLVEVNQAALAARAEPDAGDELGATFRCDGAMRSALGRFRAKLKLWRASIDAGRVIQNFGSETEKLMRRVEAAYEEEAEAYSGTVAFSRKRSELQAALLADAYVLFSKQLLKLRENAYQVFRSKLARIRINDAVERNIRGAIADAESHFVRNVTLIRCPSAPWRFDNERLELVNHMRNDSMERLQLAKLQGNYVPNIRIPVAFAFHTLLAAPFGKDSRIAAQSPVDDMKATYDPDKIKQPSMMRTRPFQRGHKQKLSSKEFFSEEDLNAIAPFYEGNSANE